MWICGIEIHLLDLHWIFEYSHHIHRWKALFIFFNQDIMSLSHRMDSFGVIGGLVLNFFFRFPNFQRTGIEIHILDSQSMNEYSHQIHRWKALFMLFNRDIMSLSHRMDSFGVTGGLV